jgi:hypothetical protein
VRAAGHRHQRANGRLYVINSQPKLLMFDLPLFQHRVEGAPVRLPEDSRYAVRALQHAPRDFEADHQFEIGAAAETVDWELVERGSFRTEAR